jgi:hypothetical protein
MTAEYAASGLNRNVTNIADYVTDVAAEAQGAISRASELGNIRRRLEQ